MLNRVGTGLALSKTETRLTHAKQDSELDALTDDKYNKNSSIKNEEKQPGRKSRKDRTPEEDEEILDLMYPSMRHLGRDKVNKTDDEISISKQNNRSTNAKDKSSEKFENDKKGTFTGGAAKIPETISNNENKQADKILIILKIILL